VSFNPFRTRTAHPRVSRGWTASYLVVLLAVSGWIAIPSPAGQAQDTALDRLDRAMDSLDAPSSQPANARTQEDLMQEIDDLRQTLRELTEVLDDKILALKQLEDENENLRQALRLHYGGQGGLPPVPIPNRDLIESVLEEGEPFVEREESVAAGSVPETYTVVSEWGRSPEVAASLPGDVSSLIGMALAVSPGMTNDQIEALALDLRENYDAYDNINIEVFDDIAAARSYANEGDVDDAHRVLTISRFRHSGRDEKIVYRDGAPVALP
jgi:hypothetical protein